MTTNECVSEYRRLIQNIRMPDVQFENMLNELMIKTDTEKNDGKKQIAVAVAAMTAMAIGVKLFFDSSKRKG